MKTDKNGQVIGVAIPFGIYTQEVFDSSGQALSKRDTQLVAQNGTTVNDISMEVSGGGAQPKISKEELEKMKAERDKALG